MLPKKPKHPITVKNLLPHTSGLPFSSPIEQQHQLISVFLVQHAGWSNDGNKILPAFLKAATEAFASSPPKP